MNTTSSDTILLMLDLQADYEKAVSDLIARYPGALFSIILDSCAPPSVVEKFRGYDIIRYSMSMSLITKLSLVRSLRNRRFSKAYFIGANYDLRQIGVIWSVGAEERKFIRTARGGLEENIRFYGLVGVGIFRFCLFILLFPWIISLRFIFVWEKYRKETDKLLPPTFRSFQSSPRISVVIPNYNGRELLKECLPSIIEAVEFYGNGSEILIVDDASTDDSTDYINRNFPSVKMIKLANNAGFGRACHIGIEQSSSDLVALLNSDILAERNFLLPLVACFKDPEVFAVQPRAYSPDGKSLNFGLNVGRQESGYIRIWNEADTEKAIRVDKLCETLYCLGGAMLFDRRKYYVMGGFDRLFYPFRWEDIDLSYRALKRGWKVLYQPESVVYHKHHATLKKVFSSDYLNVIELKNELLFTWKNLLDPLMIEEHFRRLPGYLLTRIISGHYNFCWGFVRALIQLPLCLKRRMGERSGSVRKDRQVLSKSLRLYNNYLRGDRSCGQHRRQVLILNPVFPYPPIDGGKTRVYNLIRDAAKTNDIHLLCYIEECQKSGLDHMREICRSVTTVDSPPSFGYMGRLNEVLFPMYYRGSWSEEFQQKLIEIIREKPLDIVQMEFDKMLYFVRLVEDLPTIYIEHDVASLYLNGGKNPPHHGWQKIIDVLEWLKSLRWEVVMGRQYHKIVALSPQDEEVVKTLLPGGDICSVKHGTKVSQFYREYREINERSLIYVGSFGHYPNVEAILYFCREVWPLVKSEVPDTRLIIVGSHPTAEVSRLGDNPGIEVTGFVEDISDYLDPAMVFIAPMRKGFGMKGKILEALVSAKPVVTTSIGIRGAEVRPGTHLLVGDNPQDFSAAVISLLRDPVLRENIARAGQKLVIDEYDWSKSAEQMDILYDEMLN